MPGLEDEGWLVGTRVRQRELGIIVDLAAAGDGVDVEGARSPPHAPFPASCLLGRLAAAEDLRRWQVTAREQDSVEVVGLVGSADRARLEDRGDRGRRDPRRGREAVDACLQVRKPVAEGAAKREDYQARVHPPP